MQTFILFLTTKNHPNVKSTGKWKNKMWYIHIIDYYLVIIFKKKKKIADTLKNTDKSQNPYAEWSKLNTKENILYGLIHIKL